ncbi:hypothetical protein HY384_03100 [Candidatus Daviesbacteria bacterium]|nr:hypothetical protein [Candidatus Daviesbacteria bacterium]
MDKIAFTLPNSSPLTIPNAIPANLKGDFTTSGYAFIQLIIDSLFLLITLTSLIFILVAGIRWITSRGEVETVKKARKQLMYSIIGLIVGTMAFFLVRTLIAILGGDPNFWKLPGSSS